MKFKRPNFEYTRSVDANPWQNVSHSTFDAGKIQKPPGVVITTTITSGIYFTVILERYYFMLTKSYTTTLIEQNKARLGILRSCHTQCL